jgi:hypothetical protein
LKTYNEKRRDVITKFILILRYGLYQKCACAVLDQANAARSYRSQYM